MTKTYTRSQTHPKHKNRIARTMTAPLATTSSFPTLSTGGSSSISANRCHQKQMQSPQKQQQQKTTKITPTTSSSKQNKNDSNSKILSAVNDHAAKVMKGKLLSSKTTLKDQSRYLPQFSLEEISMGKFLGKGFFGMVYEINNFNLADDKEKNGRTETERQEENISSSSGGRRKFPKFRLFRSSGTSFSNHHHSPHRNSSEEEEESEMMMMINYGPSITPNSTIKSIVENDNHHNNKLTCDNNDDGRTFMAQHCLRREEDSAKGNRRKILLSKRKNNNMKSRYAIKKLRQEVINDPTKLYYQGIMDINSETVLLSTIEHPNIIKLRAIATSSNFKSRFQSQYFIILDRLYDTLEKKVHGEWKQRYQRMGGNNLWWAKKVMDRKSTKRNKLWLEKMIAAYELSTALEYLHSKRIIHRDLKLDNIGFDIRGDIKIFDFGLAKELPPQDEANSDGAWKMTGETGTPRYMSREVALNLPYNSSSDTYTFCIVLWEMLTMKVPYELYTYKSFVQRVWNSPHKRPPIDDNTATNTTTNGSSSWPSPIKLLLKRGWSPSMDDRLSMLQISEILGKQVQVASCLEECDNDNTNTDIGGAHSARRNDVLASRRSTFVWEPPERSNSGSNASLFSMISSAMSSPFVKKSPFPYNKGKIGSPTPRSQASKKDKKILLDGTQETQQMVMLSPSNDYDEDDNEYASSNQNNSVLIVDGPVGLPCAPPLFDDDDDDDIQLPIVSEMVQDSSTMMMDLSNKKVEADDDDDTTSAQEEEDEGEKENDEEEEEGNAPPCIDPATSTDDVVALCQSTAYITTFESSSSEEMDSLYVSEETEMDTTTPTSQEERATENYKDGTITTTDSPITKNRLWEMIEKEKERRETIRAHLASYKADTAALE